MTALCADPAYDPDWWSVDADPLDRCVANGICSRCPDRRQCAATAAATPGTTGLYGCRWFPDRKPLRFCAHVGCVDGPKVYGLCQAHYQQLMLPRNPQVCEQPVHNGGLSDSREVVNLPAMNTTELREAS